MTDEQFAKLQADREDIAHRLESFGELVRSGRADGVFCVVTFSTSHSPSTTLVASIPAVPSAIESHNVYAKLLGWVDALRQQTLYQLIHGAMRPNRELLRVLLNYKEEGSSGTQTQHPQEGGPERGH